MNSKTTSLMITAFLVTVLLMTPATALSTDIPTEVVSSESTLFSFKPSLAVDAYGNIHVAWYDQTDYNGAGYDYDIFYKAKIAGSWTVTEVVSTESTSWSLAPSLAIDSDGNVHIAWHDETDYGGAGTDYDIFYKNKTAAGWSTTEVVSTESTDSSWNPSLAVDSDGNVHIAWHDLTVYGSGTDQDIFYKNKTAAGWSTTEVVSAESDDASGYPSLAIDTNGNVYVAWEDETDDGSGADQDIFYRVKFDGSWRAIDVVSTESTGDSDQPSLTVDSDGNVHVTWSDGTDYGGAGTDGDIFYKARIAGSWTTTEVVSTESTVDSRVPSLAVDPDGNIRVAWEDLTNYGGAGIDQDIFYKTKIDGSWTVTEVVSTESDHDSGSPSLAVDAYGIVHVTWDDKTDYGEAGTDEDIFYKMIAPPLSLYDLIARIDALEAKIDAKMGQIHNDIIASESNIISAIESAKREVTSAISSAIDDAHNSLYNVIKSTQSSLADAISTSEAYLTRVIDKSNVDIKSAIARSERNIVSAIDSAKRDIIRAVEDGVREILKNLPKPTKGNSLSLGVLIALAALAVATTRAKSKKG